MVSWFIIRVMKKILADHDKEISMIIMYMVEWSADYILVM